MAQHITADDADLRELNGKEEQQEFKKQLDAEQGEMAPNRDSEIKQPREGWKLWRSNKVWVENSTGNDIIVYVHRFKTVAELVAMEAHAGAGAADGSIGGKLEYARKDGHVQFDRMSADKTAMRMFALGSGAGGAMVTAALAGNLQQLLCKDRYVPNGWCINLSGAPFTDHALR